MRGKALAILERRSGSRITPAYAGKSQRHDVDIMLQQDHPRLCGEKPKMRALQMKVTGSPPPMRGKVVETLDKALDGGITPAYAGKR